MYFSFSLKVEDSNIRKKPFLDQIGDRNFELKSYNLQANYTKKMEWRT